MTAIAMLRPEFVEFIPKALTDGVIYISVPYATSVHKCACGCGSKITTPLSPAKWRLLWDGDTISLWPSIGNWSYPCQSHYWIERNRIEWAPKMSPQRIDANRERDRYERDEYLSAKQRASTEPHDGSKGDPAGTLDRLRGQIRRFKG